MNAQRCLLTIWLLKWTDLYSLRYWSTLLQLYCGHRNCVCTYPHPYPPAVLMYDFTFESRGGERKRWQPWAHWFMKDRADAMCPTVGTVKTRARPTFLLGRASCVHDCVCMSLFCPFVYELSHCSQLRGWCEVASAWRGGGCGIQLESLFFFFPYCSSYLSEKHNLLRLGCESKNENTYT